MLKNDPETSNYTETTIIKMLRVKIQIKGQYNFTTEHLREEHEKIRTEPSVGSEHPVFLISWREIIKYQILREC